MSDLRSAKVELLSAQSATDWLRLQYSVAGIVSLGERKRTEGRNCRRRRTVPVFPVD
jgi:hypothetical protein